MRFASCFAVALAALGFGFGLDGVVLADEQPDVKAAPAAAVTTPTITAPASDTTTSPAAGAPDTPPAGYSGIAASSPSGEHAPVTVDVYDESHRFTYVTLGPDTCELPCRLALTPGIYPLIASGLSSLVTHVVVPAEPVRVDVTDPGHIYRLVGTILLPLGIGIGATMWATGLACPEDGCFLATATIFPVLGGAMMITGAVLLGYGNNKKPEVHVSRPGADAPTASRAPRLRLTGFGVAPISTGATGALAFEF